MFCYRSGHAGIAYRHIAKECPDQKKNIMMFHAALSDQGKEFVMDNFCTSVETDLRCIFATSAFSMGNYYCFTAKANLVLSFRNQFCSVLIFVCTPSQQL